MEEDIKKPAEPVQDEQGADTSELGECKTKCDEYLNNWKRATADMANYKKEEIERMGMLGTWAKESMILKILPIFDSFYLAEKHSNILKNVGMSEWQKGFEQIKKQIEEFLKKEGIEVIDAAGQKFNPETMEVVEEVGEGPTSTESGIVIEELQKGYKMGEKVLRPAKVKVTK